MRWIATTKAEQNRRAVDPWTAVHLSSGLALGLMDVPLRAAVAAAVAYELAEQVFERYDFGRRFFRTSGPEIVANALVDTAVLAVGHWLGQKWNATGSPSGSP